MKKIAKIASLFVLAAAPAAADTYLGVRMGSANYSYSNTRNNNQVAYGFFAGYNIDKVFSVEAEYTDLAGFERPSRTAQGSAIGISGLAFLVLDEKLSAFAKLGISNSSLEDKAKPGFPGGDAVSKNTGMSVGLGAQYRITPTMSIRGGFDIYPVGESAEFTAASASIGYVGGVFKL
jgi:opacity protein-like surface antigen